MTDSHILSSTKRAPKNLGRVLVLGLGKSGMAAVRYCSGQAADRVELLSVHVGESGTTPENMKWLAECGALVQEGPEAAGEYDLCIVSPGIPPHSPLYRSGAAISAEIVSEVEFAWRESAADSTWVAITGTNGKTTTTALAAHVLQNCGLRAAAVGNIGDTCLDAVASGDIDVYVAEVSSYQLDSTKYFAPNVAVLLNITPDHISWHGSMDAYIAAKHKVFANMASVSDAVAILDATNDIVRATVRSLKRQTPEERGFAYIPLGTADGIAGNMRERCGAAAAAYLAPEGLCVDYADVRHVLCTAEELQIKGNHNVSNALAASSVAAALGADDQQIAEALKSFAALEHRIEPCGVVRGVACYNDSKATNVDAVLVALEAFPAKTIVVLYGGYDKGTDLAPLVAATRGTAKAVVCFGAAGPRFYEAFAEVPAEECQVVSAGGLEEALDTALDLAAAGDVVLLSPACASFDEFTSFEQRGEIFKGWVAQRAAQA